VVGLPTKKPWEAAGRPGAYEPHARLADMDIDQVDAEVLYASATGGAELYVLAPTPASPRSRHERRRDRVRVAGSVAADPGLHPAVARRGCALKEVQRIANEGARQR